MVGGCIQGFEGIPIFVVFLSVLLGHLTKLLEY